MAMGYYPRKVYAIQHNQTGRMYIGSSKNVESRYMSHIALLKAGKHLSAEMQQDFDDYGNDFSLYVLDAISNRDESKKEYEWMRKYRTNEIEYGYNRKDPAMKTLRATIPFKKGLPSSLARGDSID